MHRSRFHLRFDYQNGKRKSGGNSVSLDKGEFGRLGFARIFGNYQSAVFYYLSCQIFIFFGIDFFNSAGKNGNSSFIAF